MSFSAKYLHQFLVPIFGMLSLLGITSCHKGVSNEGLPTRHHIELRFKATAGHQDLLFGNTYTNDLQEPFSVRTFKFYIGSVRFINDSTGSSYQANKNQYYLVNFADSASLSLPLSVTAGQYSRIAFTLGVDSLHNVSGAQTGALDPANGMFWTWNSGYLMAKLEGYSTVFTQPNNIYEYHIGGFKGAENVVQDVSLYLPAGDIIDTQKGKISSVTVAADVLQWFSGSYPVSIATTPVCTTPGPLAVKIAGNYSTMFTVEKVVNQ